MFKYSRLLTILIASFVSIAQASSAKKVTFALESNAPVGATSSLVPQHRDDRMAAKQRKNLKRIITPEELKVLQSMSSRQLEHKIAKHIPLPKALQISSNQLYRQVARAAPDDFEKIFNNSVMMAGDVSLNIFESLFNVSCLNEEILNEYVAWLHSRLVPAITQVLNNRVSKIKHVIDQEHKNYTLMLENRGNEFEVVAVEQEGVIRRIAQSEIATMVIVPVAATIQSRFYESATLRWISWAAFAGLTIQMMNQYSRLIQQATKKRNQNRRFQQIVEQQQAKTVPLKIPEIKVVDEVTGKLIRDFFDRCNNFAVFEQRRLHDTLQKNQRRQEALVWPLQEEEQLLATVDLDPQPSPGVTAVRTPVARQLFALGKSLKKVYDFFQRK